MFFEPLFGRGPATIDKLDPFHHVWLFASSSGRCRSDFVSDYVLPSHVGSARRCVVSHHHVVPGLHVREARSNRPAGRATFFS